MKLQKITRADYAALLGLRPADGGEAPSVGAVADLCRWALWRWGPRARAAVTRFAKPRVEAAGWSPAQAEDATKAALDALLTLGDVARARIDGREVLAPTQPRLVTLTGDLLGVVGGAPSRLFGLSTEQVGRLVRRDDEDALAQLRACRPQELTFAQWLGPIGPARLRPQDGVAAPMPGGDDLARCWRDLTARAARDASAVEDVGRVAALTGPPGGFFGQAEDRTGRWSDLPADGEAAWLAATRGFQDSHQNYHLALTRDGAARLAGLHDQDEARWAPLLRGVAAGARERYRAAPAGDARALQLTFPAPRTLRRALTLLAADQGKWRWLARPGAADAAELALQRCGAALESSDAPR